MYRDFSNEKFPLVYYWSAFVSHFSIGGLEGARIASIIPSSLTIAILFYLLSKATKNLKLKIIFSILILSFFIYSRSFNASTELPLGLIYLIVLLCIYKSKMNPMFQSITIGILMGIAFGFRQFAILPFIVLLMAPWHRTSKIYYVSGFILSVLIWLSYFFYHGLMIDFYNSTLSNIITNSNVTKYIAPVGFLKGAFLSIFLITLLNYLFANKKINKWVILFALSCSATFFIRYGNFRLWPAFVVLLGLLFITKPKEIFNVKIINYSNYLILIVATFLSLPYKLMDQYYSNNIDKFSTLKYQKVTGLIKEETNNDEKILIYPFDPNVYCLSDRIPASRHYFIMPWTINETMVKNIVDDISNKKAKLIFIADSFGTKNENEKLILQTIKSNYSLKKFISPIPEGKKNYEVYFRND